MLNRVPGMKSSKFTREEDGALLVFFALCAAAIFLVASLSFDLGQRASTQSELQSFADNAALAAAGELNGFPGAIERAERAARELIRDDFVFGVEADGNGDAAKTLQGESDYDIYFYETLPDDDKTPMTAASALDKIPANDALARYARVVVKPVNVDWDFANILTIFSSDPLPSEAVDAEAVAGYTSLSCDVAPVFFCLPDEVAGWTPGSAIGDSILLKAGGQSGGANGPSWTPGNFTWLNVIAQAEAAWTTDGVTNPTGPCASFANNLNGKFNPDLYECLFSAGTGTLCFENGQLDTKPGGTEGVITAVFNTRFDVFGKGSGSNQSSSLFAPAPVVTTGLEASSTCSSSTSNTDTTMGLPADDCFTGHSTAGCLSYDGDVRFGNGDWSAGRLFYVDVNYSFDATSVGTPFTYTAGVVDNPSDVPNPLVDNLDTLAIIQDELVDIGGQIYHRYDPFRPEGGYKKPDVYKDFPEIVNGASQWEYYQAEVAASLYKNPSDAIVLKDGNYVLDDSIGQFFDDSQPRELIRNINDPLVDPLNPTGSYTRLGASVPNCNPYYDTNPRRRTLVAAILDCSETGPNGGINGFTKDMTAEYFAEIFLLSSSGTMRNTATGATPNNANADKEIYVQIIGPALNSGQYTLDPGRFRNLVQLYR